MAGSSPVNNAANNMQRDQESGAKLAESRRKHSEIQIKQNVISFFGRIFSWFYRRPTQKVLQKGFFFMAFI